MGTPLIVSIDTEEEGLWGGAFERNPSTKNLVGLDRFQSFCQARQILPTYLIDAPVLENAAAVKNMRSWQEGGLCEVGAHCHPWCNPPYADEPLDAQHSYLCNLPSSAQRHKLEWLTDKIEENFGKRPTSFRAGRYGMNHVGIQHLSDLGYRVDSSVLPFRNYAYQCGPDYSQATLTSYRVDGDDLLKPNHDGKLIEIPITAGYTRGHFAKQNRRFQKLREAPLNRLRIAGILERFNLLRWVKLSPEQTSIADAIRLIDGALREGVQSLVLMFHSTSLVPTMSPYVGTDAELDEFYHWLEKVVGYCLTNKGCVSTTLTESAALFEQSNR